MRYGTTFTKKDVFVGICCLVFLIMTIGAVGSSGRRKAKAVVCSSNLKQLGIIAKMFTDDHDGYFWNGSDQRTISGVVIPSQKWYVALEEPYQKVDKLRVCPMAKELAQESENGTIYSPYGSTFKSWGKFSVTQPGMVKGYYGSYMNNSACYNAVTIGQEYRWKAINVANADEIPLLFDAAWYASGSNLPSNEATAPPIAPDDWGMEGAYRWSKGACINRHDGNINMLFFDLSVRPVGLKSLWSFRWYQGYTGMDYGPPTITEWPQWMQGSKAHTYSANPNPAISE